MTNENFRNNKTVRIGIKEYFSRLYRNRLKILCDAMRFDLKKNLQLTASIIRLLTVGGTPFEAIDIRNKIRIIVCSGRVRDRESMKREKEKRKKKNAEKKENGSNI